MWRGAGDGSPVSGAQAPRPRLLGAKASPGSPLPRAEANPAIRYGARGKRRPSPVPPPVVTARGKRVSSGATPERTLCLSKEVEAVACSRALSRRTRRTSPDAECSSSTLPEARRTPVARRLAPAARPEPERPPSKVALLRARFVIPRRGTIVAPVLPVRWPTTLRRNTRDVVRTIERDPHQGG